MKDKKTLVVCSGPYSYSQKHRCLFSGMLILLLRRINSLGCEMFHEGDNLTRQMDLMFHEIYFTCPFEKQPMDNLVSSSSYW